MVNPSKQSRAQRILEHITTAGVADDEQYHNINLEVIRKILDARRAVKQEDKRDRSESAFLMDITGFVRLAVSLRGVSVKMKDGGLVVITDAVGSQLTISKWVVDSVTDGPYLRSREIVDHPVLLSSMIRTTELLSNSPRNALARQFGVLKVHYLSRVAVFRFFPAPTWESTSNEEPK